MHTLIYIECYGYILLLCGVDRRVWDNTKLLVLIPNPLLLWNTCICITTQSTRIATTKVCVAIHCITNDRTWD